MLAPSSISAEDARIPIPSGKEWDSFHGQLSSQKYSPLTQINKDNVGKMQVAWTFSTGEGGYCDFNDASEYVGGDALYTNPDGAVVMPVGSYSVRETKAPDGYLVDPTTYTAQVKIDPDAASGQGADWVWDANPNSKHIDVDQQGNATLTQSEQVALGGLSVQKYDAESGSDLPMGSATLAGAEPTSR